MLGWIARAGVLRFLGRRAVPLLAAYEVFQLVRGWRRGQAGREPEVVEIRRRPR
jgi:hypothetical protein